MSSNKALRRVNFSPDAQENPTVLLKHGNGNRKRVAAGIFTFRLPKTSSNYSPARILRRLGAKVSRVVRLVAMRRKQSSSRKVSSASSLTRSRSVADALDSQRAEAIEDCIEFLNSNSSSLHRSNSVSTISNY
ncbi:josephin-like protein [Euphorbia lathyris]|uniref:josephin-like protein n=1 Tax=Euphorbia lathyris TaxID=212925 RepID=UPI003313692E